MKISLSRRDFLKMGALSLLGLAAARVDGFLALTPDQQGRVLFDDIIVYDKPSFGGNAVRKYWHDTVLTINEATVGDEEPAHNRVWYLIDGEGYTHSGGIQPVRTIPSTPITNIPPEGMLAEVTVPYTDARWAPDINQKVLYRFYFETTHWINGLSYGDDGIPWYHILDDKWGLTFYVPARHLRPIPARELATISPNVASQDKRIEVDTANQLVIAYERDHPVFMAKAATGAKFSNGTFYTPSGCHYINQKMPSRHMRAGNLAYNGYDLPGIPWVSYITENGIAFHGTYWHNDYGLARSHGCINLTSQAAKWIYRWSLPAVPCDQRRVYEKNGTRVDVI
ncbi:MAG: L,D-transpeptidase [Chloroflexota bacterium]|nr:L,D-transpeptidase [Chloroflexota bacterium]